MVSTMIPHVLSQGATKDYTVPDILPIITTLPNEIRVKIFEAILDSDQTTLRALGGKTVNKTHLNISRGSSFHTACIGSAIMRCCLEPQLSAYLSATYITIHVLQVFLLMPTTVLDDIFQTERGLKIDFDLDYTAAPWYRPHHHKDTLMLQYHNETCNAPRMQQIKFVLGRVRKSMATALKTRRRAKFVSASDEFHLPSKLILDFGKVSCNCGGEDLGRHIKDWLRPLREYQCETPRDCRRGMNIVVRSTKPQHEDCFKIW